MERKHLCLGNVRRIYKVIDGTGKLKKVVAEILGLYILSVFSAYLAIVHSICIELLSVDWIHTRILISTQMDELLRKQF